MRILALFPYPARETLRGASAGNLPDTFLMGLNHLGSRIRVDMLDPNLSRASDALWAITRFGPISGRYFAANLIQQLRALGRVRQYDALVIRDLKNVLLPALSRRAFKTKVFTVLLNAIVQPSGRYASLMGTMLQELDVIAHDTRAMAETFVTQLGVEETKLWHLPYGVDTEFFRPIEAESEDGVVSVGDTNRDYGTLVRSLKQLGLTCRIFASRVLPLSGMPDFDLKEIPPSVAAVSYLDVASLRDAYKEAKLVVIPLHETTTGSGVTSMLEAMSMGKAVIVARTSGLLEYIEDGNSVVTYRPGDHLDLAGKIDWMLQDGQLREKLGREARVRVTKFFSTAEAGRRIRELLEGALVRN